MIRGSIEIPGLPGGIEAESPLPRIFLDTLGPYQAVRIKLGMGIERILVSAEDPNVGRLDYLLDFDRFGQIAAASINFLQPDESFIHFFLPANGDFSNFPPSVPEAFFYDSFGNNHLKVGLTDARPALTIPWAGRVSFYPLLEAKAKNDDQSIYPPYNQFFLLGRRPVKVQKFDGLIKVDLVCGPDCYDMAYNLFSAVFPTPLLKFPWLEFEELFNKDPFCPYSLMNLIKRLGFLWQSRISTQEEIRQINQLIDRQKRHS